MNTTVLRVSFTPCMGLARRVTGTTGNKTTISMSNRNSLACSGQTNNFLVW